MKITFPRTHKREDVRPLYEKLKRDLPTLFDALKADTIAGRNRLWSDQLSKDDEERMRRQYIQLRQFIRDNADCNGATAVSYVSADIIGLLTDEVVAELGIPKSQAQLRADRRLEERDGDG